MAFLVCSAIFCFGFFIAIAENVVNKELIVLVDSTVADGLHISATPVTIAVFSAITLLGNEGLLLLSLVIAFYCMWKRNWLVFFSWIAVVGSGLLLNGLLKSTFMRPRPIFLNPILLENGYSFPSGHAMAAMIAYGLLAYLVCLGLKKWRTRLLVILGFAVLISLIGLSRLVLGAHYPSDVVAGFAAGGFWLIVSIMCLEMIRQVHAERPLT
jgi:membrane-associated phospholipid phosphatase